MVIHTVTRDTPGSRTGQVEKFKDKVRGITQRNSPVNLEKVIKDLNPVTRGFTNYFRVANCQTVFRGLDQWIRRRLRAKQLKLWKKPKRLHRRLRQLGYQGEFQANQDELLAQCCKSAGQLCDSQQLLEGIGAF